MIKGYLSKEAAKIGEGKTSRRLPTGIQSTAARRLAQLDAATSLQDLASPGNNLEALKGDGKVSTASASIGSGASVSAGPRAAQTMWKSSITTEKPGEIALCIINPYATLMKKNIQTADELLPIPHPGETLLEDYMKPLGLSSYAVAKALGATPITISKIIRGQRGISAEMALRLGRYTNTNPQFWLNLQTNYDLAVARREKETEIGQRVTPLKMAA